MSDTKKRLAELEAMIDKDSVPSTPEGESSIVHIPQIIKPQELTDKQLKFIDEYMVDLNATQAAIRSGYSEVSSAVQAHRLLMNDKVRLEIQQRQQASIIANGIKRANTYKMLLDTINDINIRIAQDQEGEFIGLITARLKTIDKLNKMGGFYAPDVTNQFTQLNAININIVKSK